MSPILFGVLFFHKNWLLSLLVFTSKCYTHGEQMHLAHIRISKECINQVEQDIYILDRI